MRKKRKPSKERQQLLLTLQDNRCFWCTRPFSTPAYNVKKDRLVILSPTWDHVDPYAFTQSNCNTEFVAACQLCNAFKHSLIFSYVKECRDFCKLRAETKGWTFEGGKPGLSTRLLRSTHQM